MGSSKQSGFTLIETLVALVVFSLGILGAGALVVTAVKNSHNSYLRTQASFLADSLAERLRANPVGVWRNDYNGVLDSTTSALPACGGGTTACTPTQVAARDRRIVADNLSQQLPNGRGDVLCAVTGAAPLNNYGIKPVDGSCTLTITWNEKRDVDVAGYGGAQRFQLVMQP